MSVRPLSARGSRAGPLDVGPSSARPTVAGLPLRGALRDCPCFLSLPLLHSTGSPSRASSPSCSSSPSSRSASRPVRLPSLSVLFEQSAGDDPLQQHSPSRLLSPCATSAPSCARSTPSLPPPTSTSLVAKACRAPLTASKGSSRRRRATRTAGSARASARTGSTRSTCTRSPPRRRRAARCRLTLPATSLALAGLLGRRDVHAGRHLRVRQRPDRQDAHLRQLCVLASLPGLPRVVLAEPFLVVPQATAVLTSKARTVRRLFRCCARLTSSDARAPLLLLLGRLQRLLRLRPRPALVGLVALRFVDDGCRRAVSHVGLCVRDVGLRLGHLECVDRRRRGRQLDRRQHPERHRFGNEPCSCGERDELGRVAAGWQQHGGDRARRRRGACWRRSRWRARPVGALSVSSTLSRRLEVVFVTVPSPCSRPMSSSLSVPSSSRSAFLAASPTRPFRISLRCQVTNTMISVQGPERMPSDERGEATCARTQPVEVLDVRVDILLARNTELPTLLPTTCKLRSSPERDREEKEKPNPGERVGAEETRTQSLRARWREGRPPLTSAALQMSLACAHTSASRASMSAEHTSEGKRGGRGRASLAARRSGARAVGERASHTCYTHSAFAASSAARGRARAREQRGEKVARVVCPRPRSRPAQGPPQSSAATPIASHTRAHGTPAAKRGLDLASPPRLLARSSTQASPRLVGRQAQLKRCVTTQLHSAHLHGRAGS